MFVEIITISGDCKWKTLSSCFQQILSDLDKIRAIQKNRSHKYQD